MSGGQARVAVARQEVVSVEPADAGTHRLALRVVNRPGVMVGVTQVFASLNVNIDTLKLDTEGSHPNTGDISITVHTDERTLDLVCRKLRRLLDVLEVSCT